MKIKSQHISLDKQNLSSKWWIFAEFVTTEDCKAGFRNCLEGPGWDPVSYISLKKQLWLKEQQDIEERQF